MALIDTIQEFINRIQLENTQLENANQKIAAQNDQYQQIINVSALSPDSYAVECKRMLP